MNAITVAAYLSMHDMEHGWNTWVVFSFSSFVPLIKRRYIRPTSRGKLGVAAIGSRYLHTGKVCAAQDFDCGRRMAIHVLRIARVRPA